MSSLKIAFILGRMEEDFPTRKKTTGHNLNEQN